MDQANAHQRGRPGRVLLAIGIGLAAFVLMVLGAPRADAAKLTISDQSTKVTNEGDSSANTGGNTAIGNNSVNTATNDQDATATGDGRGDAVAFNSSSSSNTSDGSATIATGDASATGATSATNVSQGAASGGDSGLTIADQSARVTNDGDARANSGDNLAIGNNSINDVTNEQEATADTDRGDATAANLADVSNVSDGSALITTGDASATGVASDTQLQQWLADGSNHGITIADQSVRVRNDGDADANTGDNVAIGNNSINSVDNDQDASADSDRGDGLATNIADVVNRSDGSASVHTGNASATGVDATIAGSQAVTGGGGALTLADQSANLRTDGDADAVSGDNLSLGNNALNAAVNDQEATLDLDNGSAIVTNLIDLSNISDGSGNVSTGNATSWGTIVDLIWKQEQT
jgi:hypothetical protein